MALTVDQVISAIDNFAAPELEALFGGLCPCLPVEALLKLGEAVAKEIEARNEADAMRAAVKAADAEADAAEQADLELKPTGGL